MTKDPVVTLKVAGQLHRGWKKAEITRSIETIAGGFSLTMSDWDPARRKIVTVAPGMACEVDVDGETVITGYVDDSGPEFDSDNHEVMISGRDRTGDLVDCAAYVPSLDPTVGYWNSGTSTLDIVKAITKPFNINVKAEVPVGTNTHFGLHPAETAFQAIDRLAREAAILPMSDGLGNILLTVGGMGGPFAPLHEGVNIKAARGAVSWRERFSDYWVFLNDVGYTSPMKDTEGRYAKAPDPAVKRWRPKIILTDFAATSNTPSPTAIPDYLQQRATWEATVAAARAYRHILTVQGWRDDGGKLWQPNGLVPVTSSMLGIGNETLIIAEVKWLIDEEGSRTELTVTRPDTFKRIPVSEAPDFYQAPAGKAS